MAKITIDKFDVLNKLLDGKSFQIIADELGCSKSTVANAVEKLRGEIGRKNIDTLLEIAAAVKRSDTSFAQILSRITTSKILEKLNLDDQQAHDLLTKIIPKINDNVKPSELIDTVKKILDLQESTGMSLDEIQNYCDVKSAEIESRDTKYKEVKEKAEQSTITTNNILKENNVTIENLNEFVKARNYLNENGGQIDELPSVTNMIQNSAKLGHDPKKTSKLLSEGQTLEQKNAQLEAQYRRLSEQIQAKTQEYQKLDKETDAKRHELEIQKRLKDMGVLPEHQMSLYHKIIDIGEKNKIPPPDIIERIIKDIETNYDAKIGFENELQQLKQDVIHYTEKLDSIKSEKIKTASQVKTLSNQKDALEASIIESRNFSIRELRSVSSEQKKIFSEHTDHAKISLNSIAAKANYEIIGVGENTQEEIAKLNSELKETISEISKTFEEFGHYKYLKALSNAARGKGTLVEICSANILTITGMQIWMKENNINDYFLSSALESLKKKIEEMLSKNAQAA